MQYRVARTIAASPDRVWALLADVANYPAWNPTILRTRGEIVAGGRVKLWTSLSPRRAFAVEVAELQPPCHMVWTGGLPLGLFRGVRVFSLEERTGGDATSFRMEEVFSGPLLPLMRRVMPDLSESFEQFADSLKRAAEAE